MMFKKGDFLEIPTDGTYRCILSDNEIAVFAAWRYARLHLEFLRIRKQDGGIVETIEINESDMIESFKDVAFNEPLQGKIKVESFLSES